MDTLHLAMDGQNNLLWKKVLGEIETEVSRANFFTLFKPTALLSLGKQVATIAAPSTMIIDLLQKRYYQIIKKTVDKHTGVDTKIIFVPKTIGQKTKEHLNGPLFAFAKQDPILPANNLGISIGHLPRVRTDYTFQTIAVSSSNQLAYVSATTVAQKIGQAYNPLFIYGPVGVGKTHLMQAIANEVYRNNPSKKIIYITSEEFTNEVVEAIKNHDTLGMKRKFRNVDLFIIDDVQFFTGKEKVQEELFHTFNILVDRQSQVVLSSDRHPSEIKKIEKRLSSRFGAGLTVDIGPQDFELRTAIVLIKAKKYNLDLPIDIAKKIAEKAKDARGVEGLLLRVVTEAKAKELNVSSALVDNILGNQHMTIRPFNTEEVIENVCAFYKIKPTQIKGPRRNAHLVRVRQIIMYLLKKETGLSFVEIGNVLGGRDHTTVMYGFDKIENLLNKNLFSGEMMGIISFLKEKRGIL